MNNERALKLSIENTEQQNPIKVLLVDDDSLIRMHLQMALSREGFEVTEASSGHQALSLARKQDFDVALMDVRMPGMDGFSTCENFKTLPGKQLTPVIMITGLDDIESIQRASDVGATDYVTKPLSAAVLSKRLHHIVQAQVNAIELEKERASQAALMHAIPDTILRFAADGLLIAAKFSEASPVQLRERAIEGTSIEQIFAGVAPTPPSVTLIRALNGSTPTFQVTWKDGQECIHEVRFVASNTREVTCLLHDVTRQIHQQKYIETLSLTDSLTGLANRARFFQVTQRCLNQGAYEGLSMLQLNFDTYPTIKNSIGSKTADKVIVQIANRLVSVIGKDLQLDHISNDSLPFIARTGEAEFHILVAETTGYARLNQLLLPIFQAFEQPLAIDKYEFRLPFRSGAAGMPVVLGEVEQLFKMTGLAAQKACDQRSKETVFYTFEFEQETNRSLLLEANLHKALSEGGLNVIYQPKVCAQSGELKGVEALLRWHDSELGFISPAEFIPLAEETGLIIPIGEFVLEQACKQSKLWQQAGYGIIPIAVNVSGHQFNQANMDEWLFGILEHHEVAPGAIEIEITESVLVEQQHVLTILQRIRERGIRVAIDDFGTGYSSLSMLKQFSVDILKIDRSFVKDIEDAEENCNIANAIIALGQAMGLTLVAEGVETEAQLAYFRDRSCELIQGYHTGRPMPADEIGSNYFDV